MKLSPDNLEKLYKYFIDGGSHETEDVAKFLNISAKDEKAIGEVIDQLSKAYPKLTEEMEEAEKKRSAPKKATAESFEVILVTDGVAETLHIIKQKGSSIYVEKIVPKDEVLVKIKGADVVVDLLKLRKMSPTEQYLGVSVNTLIILAEIAKAA